jgi:hypothetical protein
MNLVRARNAGLTLVEVLVGVSIMALIFTGLATGVTRMLELHRSALEQVTATSAMAARRAALESWLANALVDPITPALAFETSERKDENKAPRQQLRFVTGAARPFTSGTTRISLALDDESADPASRGLFADIQPLTSGSPIRVLLIPYAAAFEVRVKRGDNQWSYSYYSSSQLPSALRIRVSMDPTAPAAAALLALPYNIQYENRL